MRGINFLFDWTISGCLLLIMMFIMLFVGAAAIVGGLGHLFG